MNKNDIKFLYCLYKNECTSELKSFTIKKIQENVGLSNTHVRYTKKLMLVEGYINNGFQDGNASTYYITQTGLAKLKEVSK